MAHFYGSIRGSRGEATRLGTCTSGLNVKAASWQGAVHVQLYTHNGTDKAHISLIPWQGKGVNRILYDGPVSGALIDGNKVLS
jgi:hypothetical protein